MNLVIDIGNSKVKFFLFENNKTIYKEICDNQDFKKTLDSISNKNNIKTITPNNILA